MTARTRVRLRRAAIGLYAGAGALLVWSVAATGHYLGALLVATVVAVAGWIGVRTARPRRATDAELLALADAVRERPGRHACDTPTTVMPQVKP